ncbi:hypothetical protein ACGFIH_02525 [Micromonospora parva]|uniref:hypothetical protein n=1 Tax=Micromonospora parva TaxID=1464048 RepID=UPI003714F4DD
MRESRIRRGSRASSVAIASIAVALFAISTFGLALSRDGSDNGNESIGTGRAAPSIASKSDIDGLTCEEQATREACYDIEVAGRTWRYTILPAEEVTNKTAIIDLGGPGSSALSGELEIAQFRSAHPELARSYNLLVMEEPWVTEPVTSTCQAAMGRYYLSLRSTGKDDISTTARDMAGACGLSDGSGSWGFNAANYSAVVTAIERKDKLRVAGFFGHSWGSVRLGYLQRQLDWQVLTRPFPIGATAEQVVSLRTANMPNQGVPERVIKNDKTTTPERSAPVNRFDQLSAIVELGYIDDRFYAESRAGVETGTDSTSIGRLSDRLWGRYGEWDVSPALLARIQETCSALPPPNSVPSAVASVKDLLRAELAPCKSLKATNVKHPPLAPRTCLVSGQQDAVTPDRLVSQRFESWQSHGKWIKSVKRSHGSLDGLEQCLDYVLPDD